MRRGYPHLSGKFRILLDYVLFHNVPRGLN